MTREEAIKWMEETIQDAEGLLDKCSPALKEEVLEQNEVFKIAISALRSAPQPGKPLTLDQLREMDGKPAWCEELEKWALVSVSDAGKWKDIPFALFEENSARFEWNIEGRELSLYSYPPAHIDRNEWKPCGYCTGTKYVYGHSSAVVPNGDKGQIEREAEGDFDYCPKSGRPLTDEAWAELERRLKG